MTNYSAHTWNPGDTITHGLLNNIENGIAANAGQVTDAAIAAAWGSGTGATAAADPAVRAAYGSPPPPGITGANAYDSVRNLYNAKTSNLAKTRAGVGRVISGTGFFRLLCIGDSTTEGVGSGGNPATVSYPAYLRTLLASRGLANGGTGWVIAHNNNVTDSRWTFTGSFTGFSDPLTQFVMANTTSSTATFTSDVAGTVAEVATLGTSAAFTLTVDGATPANGSVTVSGGGTYSGGTVTPGGAQAVVNVTITGLSSATHTIVATTTGTGNTYIVGGQVRSATAGLLLSNAGVGTSQTADWLPSAAFYKPGNTTLGAVAPDLTLVSLGINDALLGPLTTASYQANLAAIVSSWQALGDVILKVPPTPTTAPYSGHTIDPAVWAAYRQATYAVADSANVPLIDVGDRWGTWTNANTLGYMADGLHPYAPGYAAWAQMDLAAVLA